MGVDHAGYATKSRVVLVEVDNMTGEALDGVIENVRSTKTCCVLNFVKLK